MGMDSYIFEDSVKAHKECNNEYVFGRKYP